MEEDYDASPLKKAVGAGNNNILTVSTQKNSSSKLLNRRGSK